jgi:hypothetical protein
MEKGFRSSLRRLGTRFKSFFGGLKGQLVTLFGAAVIGRALKGTIDAFRVQQLAVENLRASLIATGKDGGKALKLLTDEAARLQKITTAGDEAIISATATLAQLAPSLDAQSLADAQTAIIAIADTFLKGDVENAALLLGKTLGSTTNALTRYGIQLDATASASDKLAEVMGNKVLGAAFAATEAKAKTLDGRLKQLSNATGDLKEVIGGIVADILGMRDASETLTKSIQAQSERLESNRQSYIKFGKIVMAIGRTIFNGFRLLAAGINIVLAGIILGAAEATLAVQKLINILPGTALDIDVISQSDVDALRARFEHMGDEAVFAVKNIGEAWANVGKEQSIQTAADRLMQLNLQELQIARLGIMTKLAKVNKEIAATPLPKVGGVTPEMIERLERQKELSDQLLLVEGRLAQLREKPPPEPPDPTAAAALAKALAEAADAEERIRDIRDQRSEMGALGVKDQPSQLKELAARAKENVAQMAALADEMARLRPEQAGFTQETAALIDEIDAENAAIINLIDNFGEVAEVLRMFPDFEIAGIGPENIEASVSALRALGAAVRGLSAARERAIEVERAFGKNSQEALDAQAALKRQVEVTRKVLMVLIRTFELAGESVEVFKKALRELDNLQGDVGTSTKESNTVFAEFARNAIDGARAAVDFARGFDAISDSTAASLNSVLNLGQGIVNLAEVTRKAQEAAEAAGQAFQGLSAAQAIGPAISIAGGIFSFAGGILAANKAEVAASRAEVRRNTEALEKLRRSIEDLGEALTEAGSEFTEQIFNFGAALKEADFPSNVASSSRRLEFFALLEKTFGTDRREALRILNEFAKEHFNIDFLFPGGGIRGQVFDEFLDLIENEAPAAFDKFINNFRNSMDRLNASFDILDIDDPVERLKELRKIFLDFTDLPEQLRARIAAADLSTAAGRADFEAAIIEAFKQAPELFKGGALLGLSIDDFISLVRDMEGIVDDLAPEDEQIVDAVEEGNTSFQVFRGVTETTGNRLAGLLTTDVVWNRETALNTAGMLKALGGTRPENVAPAPLGELDMFVLGNAQDTLAQLTVAEMFVDTMHVGTDGMVAAPPTQAEVESAFTGPDPGRAQPMHFSPSVTVAAGAVVVNESDTPLETAEDILSRLDEQIVRSLDRKLQDFSDRARRGAGSRKAITLEQAR